MGLDTSRPFTRAEARAAGLSWRQIDGPRFRRLLQGVHVDRDRPLTPALLATAALQVVPGAVVCHRTAAALLEMPVPRDDDVHLLLRPGVRAPRRQGIRVHRGSPARTSERGGVPLTTAPDTFVAVA